MLQISTLTHCVVEAITHPSLGLSDDAASIIVDGKLEKIFCDAKGDVKAIKEEIFKRGKDERLEGCIVDVQKIAGVGPKRLGLGSVISASLGVNVTKQSFKKNCWWRLKTAEDMIKAEGFVNYAAADAWGT
eukprot:CAMPEP_0118653700 /NCGR_PEP_ID=MMETSP0785-20121206/11970_1 /TAXON_ID=91992 /ORGANISM="Bolidomonas pacifica, Strain CCMP 1866" /LENGTH=130 /DNA_ID=CAMNT_0006546259 /DNA_START=567 /DNA_END=956 /DNA_ORIENTATION=+